jgi:hypothetical protein
MIFPIYRGATSPRLLRWLTNFYMPVGKNIMVIENIDSFYPL